MGGVQEVLAWLELIHSRVPSLWTPEKTPETANFLGCPLTLEAWKGGLVGLVVFSAEVGGSGARIPVIRIRIQISAQLAQPLGRSKGDSLDLVEWGRIWGQRRASIQCKMRYQLESWLICWLVTTVCCILVGWGVEVVRVGVDWVKGAPLVYAGGRADNCVNQVQKSGAFCVHCTYVVVSVCTYARK